MENSALRTGVSLRPSWRCIVCVSQYGVELEKSRYLVKLMKNRLLPLKWGEVRVGNGGASRQNGTVQSAIS